MVERKIELSQPILSKEANEKNKAAILLKHQDELLKAVEAYRDLVRIAPTFAGGWQQLGSLLWKMGDLSAAQEAYEVAFELDPTDLNIVRGLSLIYFRCGQDSKAAELLQGVIKGKCIEPSMCPAHLDLSYILLQQKRWDEAKASLLNAVLSDNSSVAAYYNLGCLYSSLEKWDDVLSICMKILKLQPNYWDAYSLIHYVLHKMGRSDTADALYRNAFALRSKEDEIKQQWVAIADQAQSELDIPLFRFESFLPEELKTLG